MRQVLDALLGAAAFGDVLHDAEHVDRLSLRVANRDTVRREDAVLVAAADLAVIAEIDRPIGLDRHPVAVGDVARALLAEQVGDRLADGLVARNAPIGFRRAVHHDEALFLHILHRDGQRHVVDDLLQERACAAQLLVGLDALGNVDDGRHSGTAVLVFDAARIGDDQDLGAIGLDVTPDRPV